MFQSFSTAISKFAQFDGRARRKEFWGFIAVSMLISALAASFYGDNGTIAQVIEILLFIPTISVAARRLHDQGRSAAWLLMALTGIGLIPLFFMMMVPGEPVANPYGPDPKAEEHAPNEVDEWYHRVPKDRHNTTLQPREPRPIYREDELV